MGTPEFAVNSLDLIYKSKHSVVGVVTAPDRPAGRGKKLRQSAVKEFACNNNIPVLQPLNLKDECFINKLQEINADIFIVVAFRMLPKIIWDMPKKGTINLHASLLPQYRGAAPINWAIINGEKQTGVSTFKIDDKIDTGNILLQEKVDILDKDNLGTLYDKLKNIGSSLLLETINKLENNMIKEKVQRNIESDNLKMANKIDKNTSRISWKDTNINIRNLIRGMNPYPGAWTNIEIENKILKLKIFECSLSENEGIAGEITINSDFYIACEKGSVKLAEVQLEGKKRMKVEEFLLGSKIKNKMICI